MDVKPLIERAAVRKAFSRLESRLRDGAKRFSRTLGTQGGHEEANVFWRPTEEFWFSISRHVENRYWCAYGTQDPEKSKSLSITVEINPPTSGFDRRIAGLFVTDASERIYLAHSGRIGGGKKGIGKEAFLATYSGPYFANVAWPDDETSEVILLADIDDSRLPEQLATFVLEVERFKSGQVRPGDSNFAPVQGVSFAPEFEGKRTGFDVDRHIESQCNHGTIVRRLRSRLEAQGFRVGNDRARDLIVANALGTVVAIVEVKTDTLPSSLYGGVGQLMIHGAAEKRLLQRVLVIPRGLSSQARSVFQRLDVDVLEYTWKGTRPEFPRLDKVFNCK